MTKYIWITTFCILLANSSIASGKYHIEVNVKSYNDSVLILTSYFGDKIKLVDTASFLGKGSFIFEGDQALPGGIYMAITGDKKKLFEFLVNDQQHFTLSTDTSNFIQKMDVKGSIENKIFFDYLKFNEQQYKANEKSLKQLKTMEEGSGTYDAMKQRIDSINKKAIDYKLEIIEDNPDLFVTALFNGMREIEIPDSIRFASDSALVFKYYKAHFWDFFDLSDSRLLRTPLYTKKVTQYFDQTVAFHPDSVMVAIDMIISKARPSSELVSYLVWHFIAKYQNPKYMGFDEVFIHLVDTYFSKEEIENTTPSILSSLQDRANKIRPTLIGAPGPDLMLIDSTGGFTSFRSITNDYIILFFWDFECGICKKESEKLKEVVQDTTFDIEVYAINVNGDLDKWKEALRERKMPWVNVNGTRSITADFHDLYDIYGTPVIYLLDKNRNIVAKRISAEQVIPFLNNTQIQPK